jgi:fructosamine-3-kinase
VTEFVKRHPGAPAGFFACEAAGLMWLSSAPGGVPCARVLGHDDISLTLQRLHPDEPARLHGDLWSGNVMWTDAGAVLIDPAAHGGHRETDLAMLALFGCPHIEAGYDGYQSVHPLREGWRARIPLHQLYPLLAHVVLFGAGYAAQTLRAARATVNLR